MGMTIKLKKKSLCTCNKIIMLFRVIHTRTSPVALAMVKIPCCHGTMEMPCYYGSCGNTLILWQYPVKKESCYPSNHADALLLS